MTRHGTTCLLLATALLTVATAGCLGTPTSVQAQSDGQTGSAHAMPTAIADGDALGYDLQGTGWTTIDVQASEAVDLTFRLTHDTMADLCTFTDDGDGVYEEHHTLLVMWPLDDDPLFDGEGFLWSGTPYNAFWPRQSGECGASEPLGLSAGEVARIAFASSVAGFHLDLTTTDAAPEQRSVLPLEANPAHVQVDPEPASAASAAQTPLTAAVDREWRAGFVFDGPGLVFTQRWHHSGDAVVGSSAAYARASLLDVGFEGATAYAPVPHGLPAYPSWGAGYGMTNDGKSLFPGLAATGGPVEAYVHEAVAAAAHTGAFDTGARFLALPLV